MVWEAVAPLCHLSSAEPAMAVAAARRVCSLVHTASVQHARAGSSLTKSAGVLEQFREKPKPVRSTLVREAEGVNRA